MSEIFSNLTAEVATLPGVDRKRHEGPNPFKEMLSASYADGQGRQVTIPAEYVADAQKLIRRASEQLKIGARIVLDDGKGTKATPEIVKEWMTKKSKAKVKVLFQAKERRVRKTKAKEETTAPAVDTTVPAEIPAQSETPKTES